MTLSPLQHQIEGVKWLRSKSHALLADEPGLGKSMQLLGAAIEPILVAAPAMVLDSGTWDDEVEKWAPGADVTQVSYSSLVLRGPRGKIKKDTNGNPLVDVKPEYMNGRYRTLILDESHYIKARKTSWTVAVQKLADYRRLGAPERVNLATGTPIPNWAHELFTTLQLIHPEEAGRGRKYGSYWRWAKEWFNVEPTMWADMNVGEFRDDRSWDDFYADNLGDSMLLRLRKDCLDLPPFTEQTWEVRMGKEQARVYRSLERDFLAWLENGTEVVAWNSAALLIKLAKCATGLESLDPMARSSGKLDALRTLLRDRPRPTLVTGHFRSTVAACERVAKQMGCSVMRVDGTTGKAGRRQAIRSFQSGNLQVLCASVETIAEGMTLTEADQIVQVEKSWKPSKNRQVVDRLYRIGQENPVLAIDLVSTGTVDAKIRTLLKQKTDQQMLALGLRGLYDLVK